MSLSDMLSWSNPYLLLGLSMPVRRGFMAFLGFKGNKVSAEMMIRTRGGMETHVARTVKMKPAPAPEEEPAKAMDADWTAEKGSG